MLVQLGSDISLARATMHQNKRIPYGRILRRIRHISAQLAVLTFLSCLAQSAQAKKQEESGG